MEVAVPFKTMEFDFNSPLSAPSTPTRIGEYYFSAPGSPGRISDFYREFDRFLISNSEENYSGAAVPFDWEEKPGKPKTPQANTSFSFSNNEDDFAFDVSGEFDRNSLSADELFDSGVIKSLKPPPRLQPLTQAKEPNPYGAAQVAQKTERGRERISSSHSSSRRTRSLSAGLPSATTTLSNSSSKGSRKWRLKDLFLFRSASDGRAMDKDPFKKYSPMLRKHEDFRNSSLRAIHNGGSRRRGIVSAHEVHYTVNRAVSNDMKKKTFLPYKQGILGRLAFNPTVHALSNGFGFSRK